MSQRRYCNIRLIYFKTDEKYISDIFSLAFRTEVPDEGI